MGPELVLFCHAFVALSALLVAAWLHRRIGLAAFVGMIAGTQYLQTVLSQSLWVETSIGSVSPGSHLMYPLSLAILYLVLVREGDRSVYAALAAIGVINLTLTAFSVLAGWQMRALGVDDQVLLDPWIFGIGTGLLLVEGALLVPLLPSLERVLPKRSWVVAPVVLIVVLAFDETVFQIIGLENTRDFQAILQGFAAKATIGLSFGLACAFLDAATDPDGARRLSGEVGSAAVSLRPSTLVESDSIGQLPTLALERRRPSFGEAPTDPDIELGDRETLDCDEFDDSEL